MINLRLEPHHLPQAGLPQGKVSGPWWPTRPAPSALTRSRGRTAGAQRPAEYLAARCPLALGGRAGSGVHAPAGTTSDHLSPPRRAPDPDAFCEHARNCPKTGGPPHADHGHRHGQVPAHRDRTPRPSRAASAVPSPGVPASLLKFSPGPPGVLTGVLPHHPDHASAGREPGLPGPHRPAGYLKAKEKSRLGNQGHRCPAGGGGTA